MDEYQRKGHLFLADAGKTLKEFRERLRDDILEADYPPRSKPESSKS